MIVTLLLLVFLVLPLRPLILLLPVLKFTNFENEYSSLPGSLSGRATFVVCAYNFQNSLVHSVDVLSGKPG